MKRFLPLAVGLSMISMGAMAATPKAPATPKPAAEASAKPADTKAKPAPKHAAHAKGAPTPAKDSGTTH
ncbi:hypothetical protein [Myxococcus landrumensis]|uniref:Uncharacterized protein n=1 Tax=Myxococcus landrumensis TaxID=2813577 RepID=A0ABX7MX71_9BACT|nr:hypothetical protein [Myxococcus landrumus]QSQ11037.1 hypothetical protein JY572_21685 [Myxococcus landrumus]